MLNRCVKGKGADIKLALLRCSVQGSVPCCIPIGYCPKFYLFFFFCTNCSYFDFSGCVFYFNSSITGGVNLSY